MNALLITYDLNKGGAVGKDKGQNYSGLYDRIRGLSDGSTWHCADSTWIIKSKYNTQQARDHLQTAIDSNDVILVVDITNKSYHWQGFKGDCATWLGKHLG
ncbi:hypothetical protein [Sulfurospirillum sp. UCH001]|uniref:hypothetical protein n=1 Tax=Sulfurospirillum sp. UCH001 TaxID=1581011 RepID=UPI00083210C5|nr:hypothetical protein [Sulfurospirillum sp. UCH001]